MLSNPKALTRQGKRTIARFAFLSSQHQYICPLGNHVFSHNPNSLPHPEQATGDSSKCSSRDRELGKGTTSQFPLKRYSTCIKAIIK